MSLLKVWSGDSEKVNLEVWKRKVSLFDDKLSNPLSTINDDYQKFIQPEELSLQQQDKLWDLIQQKEILDRWVLREGDLRTFFGRLRANLTTSTDDEQAISDQLNANQAQESSNMLHQLQVNLDTMKTKTQQDLDNLNSGMNRDRFIQLLTELMRTIQSVLASP